jgi:hypothetical protein
LQAADQSLDAESRLSKTGEAQNQAICVTASGNNVAAGL